MNNATARVIDLQATGGDLDLKACLRLNTAAPEFSRLPPSVRKIATRFDGHRDISEILQSAQFSEAKGIAIVKKLRDLGILTPPLAVAPHARSPFSELEELFFASEVAPIDECDLPFETFKDKLRRALASLTSLASA